MDRRDFLKSSAGFVMGSSLLSGLSREAHAADGQPCRFVFVVEGNCVEPVTMLSDATRAALDGSNASAIVDKRWWYKDYQHDAPLEIAGAGLATARSMGTLAGDAAATSLEDKAMVIYGLSSKISGGGHTTFSGGLSSSRPNGAIPTGPTIDGFLAALPQVRQGAPFEAVRLGIAPNDFTSRLNYATCAISAARPAPVIVDPTTAYINLFGSVDENYQAAFAQRTELLDIALGRTQLKLSQFKAACDQRAKLAEYELSLLELFERQGILTTMTPAITSAKDALQHTGLLTSSNPHDRLIAQFDMATAALIAGLTNVVVIGIGTGGGFDLEYPNYAAQANEQKRHDCHHLAQNSSEASAYRDVIHSVTADYFGLTATLARALDGVAEAGGTMLDNTAIVYLGGNGEQHHSSASEFPLLVIGGRNLGLKTDGRTVVYPGLSAGNAHRQLSSFYTTLSHCVGETIPSFGNEGATLISEGPLSEVWS